MRPQGCDHHARRRVQTLCRGQHRHPAVYQVWGPKDKVTQPATEHVWFYEMAADGYSLDDKRSKQEGNGDLQDIIAKYHARNPATDTERTAKYFMVPRTEIADEKNNFDLSLSRYKTDVFEEVRYDAPGVILDRLIQAEVGDVEEADLANVPSGIVRELLALKGWWDESLFPIVELGKHVRQVSQRNRSEADIEVFPSPTRRDLPDQPITSAKKFSAKTYRITRSSSLGSSPTTPRASMLSIDYLRHDSPVLVSPLYIVFEGGKDIHADYLLRFLKAPGAILRFGPILRARYVTP